MFNFKGLMTAAAVVFAAQAASAAITYDAESYTGSTVGGHSLWFKNGVADPTLFSGGKTNHDRHYNFIPDGVFETDESTYGRLTGTVYSRDNPSYAFDVDFTYNNVFEDSSGNPYTPTYKDEGITPGLDIYFLNLAFGTIKGVVGTALEGLEMRVEAMPIDGPYATQIGTGGNNKNNNYGLANWFTTYVTSNTCVICSADTFNRLNGVQGDVNINLNNGTTISEVPLPAGGALLLTGLGAMLLSRRRRHG